MSLNELLISYNEIKRELNPTQVIVDERTTTSAFICLNIFINKICKKDYLGKNYCITKSIKLFIYLVIDQYFHLILKN